MKPPNKKYDIIIFGASGFAGRLVAEYLYNNYGVNKGLQWAMAGRDREKLEKVKANITEEPIDILIANANDETSLDAICQKTKVLCTTVGPYSKYGSPVVAACVRQNCHYCDLTGEVPWMRKMIDRHHEEAKRKNLKIVHSCGFDSIPSDMGLLYLQEQAKAQRGRYCSTVKTGMKAMKGGLSGGTYASFREIMKEAASDPKVAELLQDPFALNPEKSTEKEEVKDLRSAEYDADFNSWKCPFVMAGINTRNVRRAVALRGEPYGEDFRYDEFALTGKGLKGRLKAYMQLAITGLLAIARPGSLPGKLVDRFAPDPGEGPSQEEREQGFWIFDLLGKWEDGETIRIRQKGDRDPGYGSTAKMLGESAVCLAREEGPTVYGVLTPSVAMGEALLERLQRNAGVEFEVRG